MSLFKLITRWKKCFDCRKRFKARLTCSDETGKHWQKRCPGCQAEHKQQLIRRTVLLHRTEAEVKQERDMGGWGALSQDGCFVRLRSKG